MPALPPDSFPTALLKSMGQVTDPAGGGVPWVRGAMAILFHDHAPQAKRQSVIDAIGGQVIGGDPWRQDGDGDYIVRIAASSFSAMLEAREAVKRMPDVEDAHLLELDSLQDAADKRHPRPPRG